MKKPRFRRICPARLMAGIALLSVVLLQPGLVLPQPVSAQAGSGTMALVGGMLLDGYETPPIHHAAVVIEGNRIVAVGPASEVEIPAGARIVNTEGMTMLPGLVDLHVHLMILGHGEYSEWWPILDQAREEMMAISARQLLMAGVTTAVDLGAPLEIIWVGMTEDDIRAVVNTAHRRGIEVHSHLYAPEDMWAAIRAGTDVIQHAGSGGNPPYSEDLIAEIAHHGLPVVQTIAHRIWVYPATLEFPERLQDARLKEDLSPDLYREFQRSFEDFQRNSYFRTTPRQIRNSEIAARQFIEGGAVIAMGTDSGSPMNFHTESAWREISALVDSGMTPLAAISAATKTGAEVIGRGRDLGTVEPGKLADIIVVEGNPLFDINVLGYVRMVVKDGIRYK